MHAGSSLAVALLVPSAAEKIYAVVGASAVCVVCYVIPVYIHIVLVRRQKLALKGDQQVRAAAGCLAVAAGSSRLNVIACPSA